MMDTQCQNDSGVSFIPPTYHRSTPMGNLRRWSTTATGNATVAGGVNTINFAEGQTPGSVNNSAREMMAQVRGIYTPSDWGWVENSATVSVASQTTFKLAGNQTSDWVAPRRFRLKSGSTTRYGTVVSSSFTVETTITVTVDSGSLSASHSLAALSVIDTNHVPTNYVTSNSASAMIAAQIAGASIGTSQIADNAVTGAKIALGSDAQGDVMYYDGTNYVRLAAGTSGHYLKTNGAGANPSWASGSSFTTLGTLTTTSGTTQTLSGLDLSSYRVVHISINNVGVNTGTQTLRCNSVSLGTGVAAASAAYGTYIIDLGSAMAVQNMLAGGLGSSNSSINTATTSISFDWSGGGTFDSGSITVYGVK